MITKNTIRATLLAAATIAAFTTIGAGAATAAPFHRPVQVETRYHHNDGRIERRIDAALHARGLRAVTTPRFNGRVYVVRARTARGFVMTVRANPVTGRIISVTRA